MAEKKHIYAVVSEVETQGLKLVRAGSQAQVRGHLTRKFTIEIATQQQIVDYCSAGNKVEEAATNE